MTLIQPTLFDTKRHTHPRLPAVRAFVRLTNITLRHFVLNQWQPMICQQALAYRDLQAADRDDAIQEAHLGALISFKTFNPKYSKVQTHIGSAAKFRLRTIERKRKARGLTGHTDSLPALTTIGELDLPDTRPAWIGATVEQLREAMKRLTNEEYLVVFHRRIAEMTGAEVAALLETTVDEIDRIEAAALERLEMMLDG